MYLMVSNYKFFHIKKRRTSQFKLKNYIGTDNIYWNDEKNTFFDGENTVAETLRESCIRASTHRESSLHFFLGFII